MKNVFKDETGNRFERLLVIGISDKIVDKKKLFECLCDCGKTVFISSKCLRNGNTKSCGCYKIDIHTKRLTKHGNSKEFENAVWRNMIAGVS